MAKFLYTNNSRFELIGNGGVYLRQHRENDTPLDWGLFDAERDGYDAKHFSPDWEVGDVLYLFLIKTRPEVTKRIKIREIECC